MQKGMVVENGDCEKICTQPDSDYARALIDAAPVKWSPMFRENYDFTPLFTASALTLCRGGKTLLQNVNLALGAGEVVGLYGASGSGKSSLADALLGLLPVAGDITFHHPEHRTEKNHRHRRKFHD